MKFVDFNGIVAPETLIQLTSMHKIDTPDKGKECIVTMHKENIFLFTPMKNKYYGVRCFKGTSVGKFFNGVCQKESEVLQIIAQLKQTKNMFEEKAVLENAQHLYGVYKNCKICSYGK